MSRRFRMTRLLKSCSRCDGDVVCIFYWFSFSCVRHGNDVLVFVAVPVPRPAIFFMTMTTPFVSLLALSCIQPRPHRSLSASLAPVTILINSLTLEVYSIAASATTIPNCGANLYKEIWRRNLDVGNYSACGVPADNNFGFNTRTHATQSYAHLFSTLDIAPLLL